MVENATTDREFYYWSADPGVNGEMRSHFSFDRKSIKSESQKFSSLTLKRAKKCDRSSIKGLRSRSFVKCSEEMVEESVSTTLVESEAADVFAIKYLPSLPLI